MINCPPYLVALLPGIIVVCGLIALGCVVLFNPTPAPPARRQMKIFRKFREPGKTGYRIHNAFANPNTPQEGIEDIDKGDLIVKVEKEISPDSTVCLEIFPKEQLVPGSSPEADPSSNVWQVQMMTDAQEGRSSDKQSYILIFHYLQNTLRIVLELNSGTSRQTGPVKSCYQ